MLEKIVNWLVFDLMIFENGTRIGESVHFFVYDSIKIMLLLLAMISFIGFIRTYIPESSMRKWLKRRGTGFGNFLASILGTLTPFCSCSSIPLFLSFVKGGVPLGIMFSFLITSPLVNEYVAVLMLGFFGWKITMIYIVSGVFIGTFGGIILGKLGLEKHLIRDVTKHIKKEIKFEKFSQRIKFGIEEALNILSKLWYWILVGVGVGALIHNYVPQDIIHSLLESLGVFSVPLAVVLGTPMYASCAAIIPVAEVLFSKGIPLGTALAFMMATVALSLPEAIILKRAMKTKLIAAFFGVVIVGIILIGYLLNAIGKFFI